MGNKKSKQSNAPSTTSQASSNVSTTSSNKKAGVASSKASGSSNGEDGPIMKLLLLGSGESGKSTIFKQMKIIHHNGYSQDECVKFKDVVYTNLLMDMRNICLNVEKLGYKFDNEETQAAAERIVAASEITMITKPSSLTHLFSDVKVLAKDQGVWATWARRNEYPVNDTANYYIENVDRISAPNFVPDQNDIVRSRVKTVGITETKFDIQGVKFKLVDVGGQRNERKKWANVVEGVSAIIFVIALSEYNQNLFEDDTVNRMQESLHLFTETVNSRFFKDTSLIVFFNKNDLFTEKIKNHDLRIAFPDYEGALGDYETALKFITDKYTSVCKNASNKRQVHSHVTCATDTQNIEFTFTAIKSIMQHNQSGNQLL